MFVCFSFCQNGFIFAGRLRRTGAGGWSEWGGALGEAGGADQSVSAPIKTLNLSEEGNGAKDWKRATTPAFEGNLRCICSGSDDF